MQWGENGVFDGNTVEERLYRGAQSLQQLRGEGLDDGDAAPGRRRRAGNRG